jgi:CBS domain containing-hemolysin-like protein
MEISYVLKLMQKKHSQLAVVIDEYGGTAGLLTLDEILEEIVGELHDEFDLDERSDIEVRDQYISVDGRVLLEDINDMLDVDLEDEDVDSFGGWIFKQLEGMPLKGKKIDYGKYIFEISEVDRLRIMRVHIIKKSKVVPVEKELDI